MKPNLAMQLFVKCNDITSTGLGLAYDMMYDDMDILIDDYHNDYLTVAKGRDGQYYVWYLDEARNWAINLETEEFISEEKISELFE